MSKWPGNATKEQTTFGGLTRGQLMSRVRSKGNETTEMRLASLLRKADLHGWRRNQSILGNPDFVWPSKRVVVFVDGCFWHGHRCGKNITPMTNAKEWSQKITGNIARDRRITRLLRHRGWHVIRIWECQLAKNPNTCINKIRRVIVSTSFQL
jgi:DNA mismatch endonuclease (patch repair protein)